MVSRGCLALVAGTLFAAALVVIPTVDPLPDQPETTVDDTRLSGAATVGPGFEKTVPGEANLVGVEWEGDPEAEFTIERRDERGNWRVVGRTERVDALPDPGSPDTRNEPKGLVSEPVWLGEDTSAVRVRLVEGTASNLSLERVVAPAAEESSAVAGAIVSKQPGIITRAQWGADESFRLNNCPEGPQYNSELKLAVVHHTVNINNYSPDQAYQVIRSIYAYHTKSLGYCDIAYNFLVDRFGRVFEGRFGGVDKTVQGAHALAFNTKTTGIALVGNFESAVPSSAAINSLEALIAWKFGKHRVNPTTAVFYNTNGNSKHPAGAVYFPSRIVGHRDTWSTVCPGRFLFNRLPEIRASVISRVYNAPPAVFPAWQPVVGQPKAMGISAFGSLYPAGGQPWFPLTGYWPGWDIVRDIELRPDGGGAYVLDGFGGVRAYGNAPALSGLPYFGFDIARDLVVIPGTTSGYVLDGWGAIHAFGGAPVLRAGGYWRGWNIARRMALAPGGAYVLTGWGSIHAATQGGLGPAPVGGGPYWPGWDIARDIEVRPGVPGAYLLDGFGGVYALGGAPAVGSPYFGKDRAVALSFVDGQAGGWVADRLGGIAAFGGAPTLTRAATPFPEGIRAFSMQP